ncbi:MAG TPA: hypothetical protein VF989_11175 [Polyangiaceae bacterium]|jgi:hypothetical protein
MRRVWLTTLLVLSTALTPRVVTAQQESLAEELFRTARAEMKGGAYAEACPKLAESQRLDPSQGTLLNLALCLEQLGRVATAWTKFRELLDVANLDEQRARIARDHAEALEPSLPRLRITVDAPKGTVVVVRLDGAELGPASLGVFLPVDPGEHRVEAWDSERSIHAEVVRVALGERAERRLSFAPNTGVPGPSAPAAQPEELAVVRAPASGWSRTPGSPSQGAPSPRDTNGSGATLRVVAAASGGVGMLALGAGTVLALNARSLRDDSNADGHCDATGCDDTGYALRQRAIRNSDFATGMFVAGGVLVAGGLTFYLLSRAGDDPSRLSLELSPRIAGGRQSLTFRGRF